MRRARRGNNAIEFALLMPILVALLTGVVDFGWYFNQRMAVTLIARDAARAGSLTPLGEDVVTAAEAQGDASIAVSGLPADVECTLEGQSPDQRVRCEVDAQFEPMVGLAPTPPILRASVTMRMEEQP